MRIEQPELDPEPRVSDEREALRDVIRGARAGRIADELVTGPTAADRGVPAPYWVTEPGVRQLPAEIYHADPWAHGESISNSDGRQLIDPDCPAVFRYNRDNRVRTFNDVYDFGHVWHSEVLGAGEETVVVDASDWKTKAAQQARDEARAAGKAPILRRELEKAQAMAAAVRDHPWGRRILDQPFRAEQALFSIDAETGVPERAMVDILPDSPTREGRLLIGDIKTCESANPNFSMSRKMDDYGYNRQAAKYRKLAIDLGLAEDAVVVFLYQEKRPPYIVTAVIPDRKALHAGIVDNRTALRTYAECASSGRWPVYSDDVVQVGLPPYRERDYEDVI
jgi:hypothetical protein